MRAVRRFGAVDSDLRWVSDFNTENTEGTEKTVEKKKR